MPAHPDPGPHGGRGFVPEVNSRFEPWILTHVVEPVARRIPRWVHPNWITYGSLLTVCLSFVLSVAAPHLEPGRALAARLVAGVLILGYLLTDSLDGMHARRTGQTSSLGEVLDHWFDAFIMGLVSAGLILTLELPVWAQTLGLVTTLTVYNAQLILYHHTRRFVHPPTSGVDAQVGIFMVYWAAGWLFYLAGPEVWWVRALALTLGVGSIATQLAMTWFYYPKLGREHLAPHALFTTLAAGFSVVYVLGGLDPLSYALLISALSFRVTGTYVLRTVLDVPYSGVDALSILWLAVLAGLLPLGSVAVYGGWTVQTLAPYAAVVTLVTVNVADLVRHLGDLRAEQSA